MQISCPVYISKPREQSGHNSLYIDLNMSNVSYFDEEEEVLDYTGFEDEDPSYLDLSSPSMSFIDEDLLFC